MSYYWEPFPFIVYLDVKSRIADDMSDSDVAALYADVSNKIGGLLHHADDPDYRSQWDVIDQSLAMWEELEDLLFNKIVGILGLKMSRVAITFSLASVLITSFCLSWSGTAFLMGADGGFLIRERNCRFDSEIERQVIPLQIRWG